MKVNMKKIGIGIAVFFVLFVVFAISAPFFIDLDKYKDKILLQTKPYLPRDVELGHIELSILTGLGVDLEGLRISDNPVFSQGDFLSLEKLKVRVQVLPLLRGKIKVKEITLKKPMISVARDAKGVFSFNDILVSIKEASKGKGVVVEEEKTEGSGILTALLVNRVEIDGGKFVYKDEKVFPGAKPVVIDDLDLKVKDISLTDPISVSLDANIMEAGKQNFSLEGSIGPFGKEMNINKLPIDIKLALEDTSVKSLKDLVSTKVPFKMIAGDINIKVDAKGSLDDKVISHSSIIIKDLIVEEAKTGKRSKDLTCSVTNKVSIAYTVQQILLESVVFSINGNQLILGGRVDNFLKEPKWAIKGQSKDFKPGDLLSLFPMYSEKLPKGMKVEGPADLKIQSSGSKKAIHFETTAEMKAMNVQLEKTFQKASGSPLLFVVKGDMQGDVTRIQANSPRIEFTFNPPSKGNKQAIKGGPGFIEALNVNLQTQKKGEQSSGSGKIEIKKGEVLSAPFERLYSSFGFTKEQTKISEFGIGIFQGKIYGSGTVNSKEKNWSFAPNIEKIEVGKMLDSMTQYKGVFSGTFSGRFQADGGKKGVSSAQGSFTLSNGELKNFNLVGTVLDSLFGLKGVENFLGYQREEIVKNESTKFDLLDGKFTMEDKVLNCEAIHITNMRTSKATNADAYLDGKVLLEKSTLDLKGKLILSAKHSESLAQKANTLRALFNEQGRMVLPITIKGTVQKPKPFLDTEFVLKATAKYYIQKGIETGIQKGLEKLWNR